MSFILDALKKSETERQRADAPALYEAQVAPPRRAVAVWLVVLAGLLVINIIILSVVLLRGSHGAAPAPEAMSPAPSAAAPVMAPPQTAPVAPYVPPVQPQNNYPPAATMPPQDAPPAESAPVASDSADDQPAAEPRHPTLAAAPPSPPPNAAPLASGDVPSYDQAASVPGANLPELKLDMHAYATNPADRFVFLNMMKLKEGQSTPQGVRVETITPDGAVLSWQGGKFFLQRQ